jgi:hypothetical protein
MGTSRRGWKALTTTQRVTRLMSPLRAQASGELGIGTGGPAQQNGLACPRFGYLCLRRATRPPTDPPCCAPWANSHCRKRKGLAHRTQKWTAVFWFGANGYGLPYRPAYPACYLERYEHLDGRAVTRVRTPGLLLVVNAIARGGGETTSSMRSMRVGLYELARCVGQIEDSETMRR